MGGCSQGAAGPGEGAHPATGRADRRPPSTADGQDREGLRVRRSGRQGRPARAVRRSAPVGHWSLHVRPALGGRVPELLGGRGRDVAGAPRASARTGHDDGVRLPRADRQDREVQGEEGMDLPLVLVVRQRFQLRLPRHAGRIRRAGGIQLPHEGRARAGGDVHLRRGRPADRGAGSERLLACRRRHLPHVLRVPRGLETMGGSYYLLDETALGRQEDWEEPKGRAADARGAVPDFS